MTDQERGAYTPPTDEPLSFDARQPVRGARPFPVTLVVGAVLLLGLIAAIFMFYRSGVRETGQGPQAVGTPVAEMKVAPPAEAQPQDPAAGLEIYQEDARAPGAQAPQFTPPPEQPQARVTTPPVVVAAPPPAAAPTTSVAAGPALRPALPTAPPPSAAPAPSPAAAAPPPPVRPAPKVVAAAAPVAAPAKPAAAAPAVAAKPAAGGAVVQIGAYSSQALADKGLADAMGIAGGGHGRSVERIQKDGHTLFRTAVTGFASRADASAYCGKLKAAGKACFVR